MKSRTRSLVFTLAFCVCSLTASIAFGFVVYGPIFMKWQALGGEQGFLREPLTNLAATPDGVGRFNHFQGGSIYWTPALGAHEVHGFIRDKWTSLGWEQSFLGYPITDEVGTPDGVGRFSLFQNGSIYWTPKTQAHEVHGFIRTKWSSLGAEQSFLGYPITDETGTPDGSGRLSVFQGGSIYWTPKTQAHEVHGFIRTEWLSLNGERGALGYPTSDEFQYGTFRRSNFQHGFIKWSATTGAVTSISLAGDAPQNPSN